MNKSGASGLPLKFLADRVDYYADNGSWVIFNRLLVVMVYGAVLFPGVENLIGLASIFIFIGRNPVPTILADTYYAIHSQHGKRRAVVYCLPLLYKRFLIHLPVKGPFVETRGTLKWSKMVMALTSFDITWANVMHVTKMITSCGEFSNVPLIGTKGCINYNPVLAIRQLGFSLRHEPKARGIEASVCFAKKEKPELLERVKTSWRKIHKKGKVFFGPKENVALHPYVALIKKRVEVIKLPFEREEPFYKQLSQLHSDEPVMIPI
ncbi:uncharacterized protein LOC127081451 [Lathyrus oleraceus]|uniref:uncharacterized protein LOC127081451 n=1 Tax=Pisum sativum TaxID=3888 RepID=UPI0021CF8741|nr:uncharacterized protein LOC127081451 [Pisum sativum]